MLWKRKQHAEYSAVVVGAGSIGALKADEFDSPKTKNILTLAHAFHAHPKTELIGIVDNNLERAETAGAKWGCPAYSHISEIERKIDLLAVCVPTEIHFDFYQDLINYPMPRLIMAEKPFCNSLPESLAAADLLGDTPVAVNYSRRYLFVMQTLRDAIENETGEVYSCTVYYDRGTIRDGSHAVDICNFLFGRFIGGSILPGRRCNDYSDDDVSLPLHLVYERCGNVQMIPCNGEAFSIFEIDIITDRGRFRFIDHGRFMELYLVNRGAVYGPYNSMSYKPTVFKTDLEKSLLYYVQHCIDYLEYKEPCLLCSAEDAIKVHKVFSELGIGGKNDACN